MSNFLPSKRLFAYFVLGAGLAAVALAAYTWAQSPEQNRRAPARAAPLQHPAQQETALQAPRSSAVSINPAKDTTEDWQIGQLRPNGLRIKPSGRSDASAVLDPQQFSRPKVKRAYALAQKIPATINKLYCWCGCENRGIHRSNLACFEDRMAVNCAVCRGTAEIAYRMAQEGITDAGRIQAAVDVEWGPEWAKREQQNRQG